MDNPQVIQMINAGNYFKNKAFEINAQELSSDSDKHLAKTTQLSE